jgi:hypothetical protein
MLGSLQLKGPIYWLHVHPTELPSKASCGLWCRKRFQTSCVPAAYPGFQRLNHWRNPAPSSGTDRNWGNVCARKRFGNRAVRDLSRAKLIQEVKLPKDRRVLMVPGSCLRAARPLCDRPVRMSRARLLADMLVIILTLCIQFFATASPLAAALQKIHADKLQLASAGTKRAPGAE